MTNLAPMPQRLNGEATLRQLKRAMIANPRAALRSTTDIFCVPRYPVAKTFRRPMVDVVFRAMNKKRITYSEAGERAGISPHTILNWRRNGASPDAANLEKIYRALGIRCRLIISGVDD